jgi:hypothetical protein
MSNFELLEDKTARHSVICIIDITTDNSEVFQRRTKGYHCLRYPLNCVRSSAVGSTPLDAKQRRIVIFRTSQKATQTTTGIQRVSISLSILPTVPPQIHPMGRRRQFGSPEIARTFSYASQSLRSLNLDQEKSRITVSIIAPLPIRNRKRAPPCVLGSDNGSEFLGGPFLLF